MTAFATPDGLVFTTRQVLYDGWPILTVTHDADDEAWQFLNGWGDTEGNAMPVLVHAEHIVELDPSVLDLADLPLGWRAWRQTRDEPWAREPQPPE